MDRVLFPDHLRRPYLVASLLYQRSLLDAATKAAKAGSDFLEIRLDSFPKKARHRIPSILQEIKRTTSLPLISTVRSPKEQGLKPHHPDWTDSERRKVYEMALPHSEMIDVEFSSTRILKNLIRLAHRLRKKVILSAHNFRAVPSEKTILELHKKFKTLSGDIFKIAATPKDGGDVGKLLGLCSQMKSTARIFIAMGELGKISRIIGFSFGSCMTYGCLDKQSAPGQIPVSELARYLHTFYSRRR